MELSKSYDHPSLLLVNEIEILFTQIRLMELYVKQAQATAGKDAARIREQFQADLTALQSELKQKDLSLETQRTLSEQSAQSLREQAENLRHQLLASEHLLARRQTELDLAQSNAAALRARLAELESNVHKAQLATAVEVARKRETLEAELAVLKTKLDGKQSALENLEASVKSSEDQLRAQIQDLHGQLAARAELLEDRTAELRSTQSEVAALRQRGEALELTVAQARAAVDAGTRIRETLQGELLALQTALEQKDLSLQQHHAASRELQDRLNGQLGDLQNRLTEKQKLLEARDQETVQLTGKTTDLQIQLTEKQGLLEARSREIDQLAAKTTELQNQLTEKQGLVEKHYQEIDQLTATTSDLRQQITCLDLTNKQTIKEARAASKALEDNLNARIRELEAIVAEKSQRLHQDKAELETAQSEAAAERQRREALELALAQAQAAVNAAVETRESLESELLALRAALEQKDLSLQQNYAATRELEDRLNGRLGDLQHQLTEKDELLEARSQEVGQLTAKTNDILGQLTEKQGLLEARGQEIHQLSAKTNDLQEEITRLQQANNQTVEETQAKARALEVSVNIRLRELETAVSENSQLLQERTVALEVSRSETSALRQQIQQLELTGGQIQEAKNDAERMRAALQSELNAAHRALEQKDSVFSQRESEFRESSDRLNAQLQTLHHQLAETQQLLEAKEATLGHTLARVAGLEERIAGLDSAVATEVEHVRQQSQSELEALRTALCEEQKALQQQQTAAAELEAKLESQNQDLRNELAERQALLERRDKEFEQLGSETGFLRNRLVELESAAREAAQSAGAEAERIRGEFQVELALVQERLNEKEQGLAESQAFIRESEQRWQSQLQDLQIQLTEKQLLCEARNVEIFGLQERLSVISDQLAALESANQHAAADAARNAALERQKFEAELDLRQEELKNMARLLKDREAQSDDLKRGFNGQLGDLQDQLTEKDALLEARSQEVGQLTAKTNDLQGHLDERWGLLEARNQEISYLTTKTNELQGQLDESHGFLEARNREISELSAKTTALQEEITRLQQANNQTVEETQAKARALEVSLNTRLRELETAVSENSQLLQERTVALEVSRSETNALRQQIQQLELAGGQIEAAKNDAERMRGALEDQERELRSARSEITTLRNRFKELDSSKEAAEKAAHVEIERLREDYQLELAGLRADIVKQQLSLEERQSTIQALEKELKDERQRLEARIAEQRSLADRSDAECRENRSEIAALREEMARSEFARRQTETLAAAQAEQLREQVKAEVGALDAQLMAKEATLQALTDQARELESAFSAKIEHLQKELAEKQSLLESRNEEMIELRSQTTDLQEQIGHLERANRERLKEHRIAATDLEQTLRLQLNELQDQLVNKQAVLAAGNDEIRRLESQVSQAELAVKQAEAKAADAIEQIRRQSESQLESLQAEINWKLEDLQRREAAVYSTENNLHAEIDALRAEVAEKRSLLENRNDELLRIKAETDGLKDRVIYLEAATEAEVEETNKNRPIQEQDRVELERLWNELRQTEQTLEQRQAAVNDSEGDIQAQINGLRNELADKQALLENPSKGFLLGDPTLSETQKEKLNRLEQLVETIKADNEQTLSPHNRRWRFSLGRKRRWKS